MAPALEQTQILRGAVTFAGRIAGDGGHVLRDENDLALGKALAKLHRKVLFPGHPDLPAVPRQTLDEWLEVVGSGLDPGGDAAHRSQRALSRAARVPYPGGCAGGPGDPSSPSRSHRDAHLEPVRKATSRAPSKEGPSDGGGMLAPRAGYGRAGDNVESEEQPATPSGWVARHGRDVVAVVGFAVLGVSLVGGFLVDEVAFPVTGFCIGAVMLTISCLLPWIVRIKAGPAGIEITTREVIVDQVEVTAALATSNQEPTAEVDAGDVDDIVGSFRWLAASDAIGRWLRSPPASLEECRLHLYLYDDESQRLVPAFEAEDLSQPSDEWLPGKGAVGIAWQQRDLVLVEGSACSDDTFGLTPEQQQRYQALAYVAAVPVLNANGEAIGVLSASTGDEASPLRAEEGQLALVALAEYIARVLVDVLKWFTDTTEE